MRLLHPTNDQIARDVTVEQAYAEPLGRHDDGRPWVLLCMVASLDGSTVVDGASGGLSSDTDHEVLLRLRSIADVVLVGAGTVTGEGYGPPKKAGQRIAVVTRSGTIDADSELFRSGAGFVVTTTGAEVDGISEADVLRCGDDQVDLAEAIRRIPEHCPGAAIVQAEGGPTLNGALARADLFDELDLSTSPAIVGGDGPRLVASAPDVAHRFTLEQLAVDDAAFVFSRWRRDR